MVRLYNFKGYPVFKRDIGTLAVEHPYRTHAGECKFKIEGDFETHAELRQFVHENCMSWQAAIRGDLSKAA